MTSPAQKTSSRSRTKPSSPLPLPLWGPTAASSAAPVAKQITITSRASGKPTPGACVQGWGYAAWFSGVSGIDSPVPSTSLTVRPRQSHFLAAFSLRRWPVLRASVLTISSGSRWRARQYAPVRTLHALKPSRTRWAAQPLTAFWHEPSASNTCRMNIDSVTVGGYSRSRCSGSSASVVSSNSGPVSTLKYSTASVAPSRRPMLLRR
jgi:hypothetical protein